ncbi:Ger(x)C family spore germination protein [Fictibacillus sp. 7GRE50]|uniref:Ger(x)C family spore germination protein n=1 Tax=unclassified Fictibacillus TaxID=2644029 RepID=UPI0018CE730F|nr:MULTISPECIES: Ger(x)C family spore germination protein [unclassified Fictibacillus]MBH0164848.1 Ger(x)C family spore germination protein [Fictibacillus sp. 7GRE50]MBH0172554.1 Ger(x)C family spore germination protein [Fictibacillus sp. 23RED33]
MMKCLFLRISIILMFVLSGCKIVPTQNTNEISIIQGVGFDLTSDKKLLGTIVYPEYKVDETSTIEILKAEGETVQETIDRSQNEVQYPLVTGQLRIALFGQKLAEKGLFPFIDTINRTPEIANTIQLAIIEGEASELLSIKKYGKENIALYLSDMIIQNAKIGELPTSDLSIFSYNYHNDGNDPYLPLLKKEKDKIKINGVGLFKDDQLITTLPIKDVFTLKMLVERFKMGTHQYKINENEFVVINNIKSTPHYKVKINKGTPEFNIQIKMGARVQEYRGNRPLTANQNKVKELQMQITRKIEQDAARIIKLLQNNGVDPIGLGSKYEAHYRDFDLKKWEEQYPDVKVKVNVDLEVIHTGVVE